MSVDSNNREASLVLSNQLVDGFRDQLSQLILDGEGVHRFQNQCSYDTDQSQYRVSLQVTVEVEIEDRSTDPWP